MSFKFDIPKHREFLGGDLLAQSLKHLGCEIAFGIHGGHLDAFLIAAQVIGIKLVDTRHETVAVQASEAYAKLSGKVGVAYVTANSGFCNGLPGIATAYADRSPIFVVTSSPPLRDAETNSLQGFHDQIVLAKPMTKFAHRVTSVEEIPRIVSYAWRTAGSGTPGPVVVDFPIDILFSPPRIDAISYGSLNSEPALPPVPNPAVLESTAKLWREAKRPVIIVGTGAARCSDPLPGSEKTLLVQLAEATSTPVFYSSKYSPDMQHDHPLRGGQAVNLAALPFIEQDQPDLIILIGARTGFLLGGRSGAIIPNKGCKLVQVDIDGPEIGRSHQVDLSIISDARQFIIALLTNLKSSPFEEKDVRSDSWIKVCSQLRHLIHAQLGKDEIMQKSRDGHMKLHPYHALNTLFKTVQHLGPIVSADGGEASVWALGVLETAHAKHSLASTGYLGFLGNGAGYSLGASFAYPDRLIINLQGDGSAGFHIQELDTYARHNCKILTVIMNNDCWGMSVAGQDIIYGTSETVRPSVALAPTCRYEIVAQGFNCESVRVDKYEDITSEVQKIVDTMMSKDRAGLVNLIISTDPVTETTKAMVGKPAESEAHRWIVVPYYDNILRPHYPGPLNGKVNGN